MPCYDAQFHESRENAVKKVQELTDMLCRLCKSMDMLPHAGGCALYEADEDIQEWWEKHKIADEIRKNK